MKKFYAIIYLACVLICFSSCSKETGKGYLTGNEYIDSYLEMPMGITKDEAIRILGEPSDIGDRGLMWEKDFEDNRYIILPASFENNQLITKSVNLYDLDARGFPVKKSVSKSDVDKLKGKMELDKAGTGIATYKNGISYEETIEILGVEGLLTWDFKGSDEIHYTKYIWRLSNEDYTDLVITYYDNALHSIES